MEKIIPISLQLNLIPNILGCYGLILENRSLKTCLCIYAFISFECVLSRKDKSTPPATVNTRVRFGRLSSMERSLMDRSGIWDQR